MSNQSAYTQLLNSITVSKKKNQLINQLESYMWSFIEIELDLSKPTVSIVNEILAELLPMMINNEYIFEKEISKQFIHRVLRDYAVLNGKCHGLFAKCIVTNCVVNVMLVYFVKLLQEKQGKKSLGDLMLSIIRQVDNKEKFQISTSIHPA